MRTSNRAAKLAIGATAGLVLALAGSTPASASSWELRDLEQRMCVTSDFGHPNTYFVAAVVGKWSKTVHVGLRNLPPGTTSTDDAIPPGSNYPNPENGATTINGWLQISIAPLPVGVYTPTLVAYSGKETQSVPITITSQTRC
ncbi:DUF5980 family protein [Nonomuraea fuscirosea]|uniref:DUF5980 family protein n=1 Tax=Nonomuraea fuscirosea TaxID=1291556 RepID=UPI002DD92E11|nr:DUF5980 family protein [Nonomuraea fuscirosea]WSA52110.1 DUF5980 family protein [Nonomuraea fuscirosea]